MPISPFGITNGTPWTAAKVEEVVSYIGNYVDTRTYPVEIITLNGAKADGKEVTDAAITTGTATLTSATAAFTSADVGKIIKIHGAGAAGAPLTTTIAGYTNATTVTLTANAGTTVSGARMVFGTDNTAAFAATISTGGSWYLPKGRYCVNGQTTVVLGNNIEGAGMGSTIVEQMSTNIGAIFHRSTTSGRSADIAIRKLTLRGMHDAVTTLGTDNDRHVVIYGARRAILEEVESVHCRQMGLTAGYCDEVDVRFCRVLNCARDGINISIADRVTVIFNRIRNVGDDAIAVHTNLVWSIPTQRHTIVGNIVEDAFGIKVLGATRVTIGNNIMFRPKGYGIYLGATGNEGNNDHTDVIIESNVINDVINPSIWGGSVQNDGIYINNSIDSFVESVVPTTPTITDWNTLSYLSNPTGTQNAGAQGIVIRNNIVRRTLPNVGAYSNWGFGQLFLASGFTDPAISLNRSGFPIRFNGAVLNASINGNVLENFDSGVVFQNLAIYLGELVISNNEFRRYNSHGIGLETGSTMRGRVRILNNIFDGDPLFESSNRISVPPVNGRWNSAAQTPTAVDAVRWEWVEIAGNSFRNLNQVTHTNANTQIIWGRNTYIFQPDSAATVVSSSNNSRGIRRPDGLGNEGIVLYEDSDPTSATYRQLLASPQSLGSNGIPTAGFYLAGQSVRNIGSSSYTPAGSAGSQYVVSGWSRMTTGTGHVLNTDWRELRVLTGT